MLKKFELNTYGRKYLLEELRKGNSYARALSETAQIHGGHIYAFLPTVLQSAIDQFQDGILKLADDAGISGKDLYHQLQSACSNMLYRYLLKRENSYVIFERIGHSQAPLIKRERNPYFVFEDEVYLFYSRSSATLSKIEESMRKSRRYPFIIGLTSIADSSFKVSPQENIDLRTLGLFTERTEMLVVGAYDDEGYVIWSNNLADIEGFEIEKFG